MKEETLQWTSEMGLLTSVPHVVEEGGHSHWFFLVGGIDGWRRVLKVPMLRSCPDRHMYRSKRKRSFLSCLCSWLLTILFSAVCCYSIKWVQRVDKAFLSYMSLHFILNFPTNLVNTQNHGAEICLEKQTILLDGSLSGEGPGLPSHDLEDAGSRSRSFDWHLVAQAVSSFRAVL